jgi:hypothetical protein
MEHMGWGDPGLVENLYSVRPLSRAENRSTPPSLAKFRCISLSSWRVEEKMIGSLCKTLSGGKPALPSKTVSTTVLNDS